MRLGDYVRQRRLALNWSQDTLAEKIDRTQKWVSRLENNQKELPEPEAMDALARALDVTVDELLRVSGYAVGGIDASDPLADPEARFYASQYSKMTEVKRDAVRAVIRAFVADQK